MPMRRLLHTKFALLITQSLFSIVEALSASSGWLCNLYIYWPLMCCWTSQRHPIFCCRFVGKKQEIHWEVLIRLVCLCCSGAAALSPSPCCREICWPLRVGLPGGAWESSSGTLEDKICAALNQYALTVLLQDLRYSKCVCFAVVLQSVMANTLFHRLVNSAETQRSHPFRMSRQVLLYNATWYDEVGNDTVWWNVMRYNGRWWIW